jgi:hypothetical protein
VNNRWVYGLELLVFGVIAARGGWFAFRAHAVWARGLGVLALLAAAVSGVLLVAFALNVPIPPLLHSAALVGALLVVAHQAARASQTVPGASAILLGIYGALAFVLPRRRRGRPGSDARGGEEPQRPEDEEPGT